MANQDADYIHSILEKIKIKSVMNTDVVKIREYEELSKAEELFLSHGIYYLPVVNQYNQLVGLLSQKYLYKTHSPRKINKDQLVHGPDIIVDGNTFYWKETLDGFLLRNVMLQHPFTLSPEDSIFTAIMEMAKRKIGCIIVIKEDKKICGIVTESDFIRLAAQILNG